MKTKEALIQEVQDERIQSAEYEFKSMLHRELVGITISQAKISEALKKVAEHQKNIKELELILPDDALGQ